MVLLTQFPDFDPLSGHVPEHHFSLLPDIARRARSILSRRTAEQIDSAARRINSEIEKYFRDLKDQAVDELTVKFWNSPEEYEEFFEWDGGTRANGRWLYRDEMDEELDIPTAQNTSEVDALKTIIENRDSGLLSPESSSTPEADHWPEGNTDELFAVLSLWLLADSIEFVEGAVTHNLIVAGECALKAMDAVCYAEHVREVKWLEQFHKKELLEATGNQEARLQNLAADTRRALAAEQLAHEREKQSIRAERLNAARHKTTNEAKDLVCAEWEKAADAFPSAEKAGIFFADWLEDKNIGYMAKGKQIFYQPRAVTGWIRRRAKEKGIKFR